MSVTCPLTIVDRDQSVLVIDAHGRILVGIPYGENGLDLSLARQMAKRTARGLTRSQLPKRETPQQMRADYRAAIKRCVHELHREAARMNDPHARQLLNGAGRHIGVRFKPFNRP